MYAPPRLARGGPGEGGTQIGMADHLGVARVTGRAGGIHPTGAPPPAGG